ncbi:hypothetical protein HC823_02275, partial [Candidatus Gracilibacteria bacterium]|nr:hypothetical protein [Candidatus Gracilibacteria bacterium]
MDGSCGRTGWNGDKSDISFGDGDSGIYESADDELNIVTLGAVRVTIDSTGSVGIGTAAPSEKLEISGAAIVGAHENVTPVAGT